MKHCAEIIRFITLLSIIRACSASRLRVRASGNAPTRDVAKMARNTETHANGSTFVANRTSGPVLLSATKGSALSTGMRRPKPMLWWHVHKAAGTSICSEAQLYEKVVSPSENCNWKAYDMFGQSGGVSCKVRAAYFSAQGATWGAVERPMRPSDICRQFSYATILRHPLSLMRSNHNFDSQFAGHDWPMSEAISKLQAAVSTQAAVEYRLRNFDNYQVRYFADAWTVPHGRIGPEHLDRAKSRLGKFDVVSVMEKLDSHTVFDMLHWPIRSTRQVNEANPLFDAELPVDKKPFLLKLNHFDMELYRFAEAWR